ncbi:MAG: high-potential iron-sulfur protein, partial [Nitrospiraceae bacterium]
GQDCASCQLFQGKPGDAWGPCPIFPGKNVNAKGWCSAYIKKA